MEQDRDKLTTPRQVDTSVDSNTDVLIETDADSEAVKVSRNKARLYHFPVWPPLRELDFSIF